MNFTKKMITLEIADDMVFHLLHFVDSNFIITTCLRVSKQWFEQSIRIPLRLHLQHNNMSKQLPSMLNCPILSINQRLTQLHLSHNVLCDEGAVCIASSPSVVNLIELDVSFACIGMAGAEAIGSSSYLGRLTHLNMRCNRLNSQGIGFIISSKVLRNLSYLDVMGNNENDFCRIKPSRFMKNLQTLIIGHNEAYYRETCKLTRSIVKSAHMGNLTILDFEESGLDSKSGVLIGSSPYLSNLTHLFLGWNHIRDEGIQCIVSSPYLTKLKKLNVRSNQIIHGLENSQLLQLTSLDCALNFISASVENLMMKNINFCNVQCLELDSCGIDPMAAKAIASNPNFTNLKRLNLSANRIRDDGFTSIVQSDTLINLTELLVDLNYIGLNGLKSIVGSCLLSHLNTLGLGFNEFGSEGVVLLVNNPSLCNLICLDLSENRLDDEDAILIAGCQHFNNLTSLVVNNNCKMGQRGILALHSGLPKLNDLKTTGIKYALVGDEQDEEEDIW